MVVENLHVSVGLARMIDVMRAVTIAAAVQTPAIINRADAQLGAAGPAIGFGISDSLAGVLRYFSSAFELRNREAALANDGGFLDR